MAISAMLKEKISRLMSAYDELYLSLRGIDDGLVVDLIGGWGKSKEKYALILSGDVKLPKPSLLVDGLQQGLRDFPLLFLNHPNNVREKIYDIYLASLKNHNLVKNITDVGLEKIIKNGKISNDFEYYVVRQAIDAAEFMDANEDLVKLMNLVKVFEST